MWLNSGYRLNGARHDCTAMFAIVVQCIVIANFDCWRDNLAGQLVRCCSHGGQTWCSCARRRTECDGPPGWRSHFFTGTGEPAGQDGNFFAGYTMAVLAKIGDAGETETATTAAGTRGRGTETLGRNSEHIQTLGGNLAIEARLKINVLGYPLSYCECRGPFLLGRLGVARQCL